MNYYTVVYPIILYEISLTELAKEPLFMRTGVAVICTTSVLLVVLSISFHLRINTSSSMPIGLYREVQTQIIKGSLVEVCLPVAISKIGLVRSYLAGGVCLNGAEPVIKEVIAVGGDIVDLHNENIQVNGKIISNSKTLTKDREGRAIPAVPRKRYVLQANELWLFGNHHIASWDSRYFGAIHSRSVLAVLRPVLVFNG
jgi:conjugative transfer signal peptidase TraF